MSQWKLATVLLYTVSVEALHSNCYVTVAFNLFGWKCSVVAVVPLICFHVEWHQSDRVLRQFGMQQSIPEGPPQPLNIHGIMLKGKPDENWGQLLAPLISQWNNRAEFRVDVYPRQKGLLSFNFDYMVWYKQKMKMFVDLKNANTTTLVFICFWISHWYVCKRTFIWWYCENTFSFFMTDYDSFTVTWCSNCNT